jgi:hypothetical protein
MWMISPNTFKMPQKPKNCNIRINIYSISLEAFSKFKDTKDALS